MFVCQRLLNASSHAHLLPRIVFPGSQLSSFIPGRPSLRVDQLQFCHKSKKTLNQPAQPRSSSSQPSQSSAVRPTKASRSPNRPSQKTRATAPRPIADPQRVQWRLSRTQEFFQDIKNWRGSRYLLSILINGIAVVIFSFWTWEAHLSDQAKKESESSEIGEHGKLVTDATDKTTFITPGQEWLLDNFTVTPINIREGRWWTLVTSLFSHQSPSHAAFNMMCSHLMLTSLCPVFGTIPVAVSFLVGGVAGNGIIVAWMSKRGGDSYEERYPGQLFGGLGMSTSNFSLLGFGAAAYPNWTISLWSVIPVKISYVVIGTWVIEASRYFMQTGWEKIQSSVYQFVHFADYSLMAISWHYWRDWYKELYSEESLKRVFLHLLPQNECPYS